MPHERWSTGLLRRVNPAVPATVAAAGFLAFLAGYRMPGAGIAIGAILAYINAVFLYQRVDIAAHTSDVARALMVMQLGLLLTFTVIGVVTFALIKISLALAIAAAAGFSVTHLGLLFAFYLTRERTAGLERKAT